MTKLEEQLKGLRKEWKDASKFKKAERAKRRRILEIRAKLLKRAMGNKQVQLAKKIFGNKDGDG